MNMPKLVAVLLSALAALAPAGPRAATLDPKNWMAQVPGDWKLSQITMPGTHDTGAILDTPGMPGTAKAQRLTIAEQLDIGVRFLDIRLHYVRALKQLWVNHGLVGQPYSFDDVLDACYTFLAAHPTETILMSIKEEVPKFDHSFPYTFEQIVADKIEQGKYRWYDLGINPYLEATRGRIVLIRRFKHGGGKQVGGIDATDWPDNETGPAGDVMNVEDYFNLGDHINDPPYYWDKIAKCTNHMWGSAISDNSLIWLTFTSGTFMHIGIPRRHSITRLAAYVNPHIRDWIELGKGMGSYGVVPMDLIDEATAFDIIDSNARWAP
ncbi:MAG: hypothetical protein A2V77_24605 [Anaeromyxobacter sp. RBG_16_69_14]|nr:MAG: hypothetical protein A2V77_24605 [Anaeromyxobacter sp. RBG_16_69_14]